MSEHGPERISVLRDNRKVPLIPESNHTPHHRNVPAQPWNGVLLERHSVSAIEIPEHDHHQLCLHLQVTGEEKMEWWSAGRHGIERTAPGSMLIVPTGTRDRIRWQGASERYLLSLQPHWMSQIAEEAGSPPPEFTANWSATDPALERLIADMGRQAAEGWPLGRLYAGLTAAGLMNLLLRRHAVNPVEAATIRGGLPASQLRHAMEYITENLAEDLRLEEIAAQVGLSPFHFAREFRNATGQTAHQYLLDQRIDRAKQLLWSTTWTAQEIAPMIGFHSPVNFVRTFRQRVGQTPGAWRSSR